jgi:hypothetical protein
MHVNTLAFIHIKDEDMNNEDMNTCAENDFRASILDRLNVLRVRFIYPASIAQIHNFGDRIDAALCRSRIQVL